MANDDEMSAKAEWYKASAASVYIEHGTRRVRVDPDNSAMVLGMGSMYKQEMIHEVNKTHCIEETLGDSRPVLTGSVDERMVTGRGKLLASPDN